MSLRVAVGTASIESHLVGVVELLQIWAVICCIVLMDVRVLVIVDQTA